MGLSEDIIAKAKEIESSSFDVEEVTYVPDISNSKLTIGSTGLKFEATVLYIDMRGSTTMLSKHKTRIVAKIHTIIWFLLILLLPKSSFFKNIQITSLFIRILFVLKQLKLLKHYT